MSRNILLSSVLTLMCLSAGPARSADKPDWDKHPENEWVKQSPAGELPAPPFGWEGSGGYDPFGKKWIHHAGHDGIPQGFATFLYDVEARSWEQKFPPTSPPGVCCVDGSNVF